MNSYMRMRLENVITEGLPRMGHLSIEKMAKLSVSNVRTSYELMAYK